MTFGGWQVPAQHWLEVQPVASRQLPPPTHSSLKKQAPPAATVPVKTLSQTRFKSMAARVLRLHEEMPLIMSTQVRAEAPS